MLKVYFKSNCATCISALQLMRKNTKEKFEKVEYLVDVPTIEQLKEIIKMLGINAEQLVRKKEPLYKEKYEGKKISESKWLEILHKNPILIERPIIVMDDKAIIGRPIETIVDFIKQKK
jgi:arsenate reductase